MTYNMSFTENATIPVGILRGINDNANGYFGGILLLAIFLLLLLIIKTDFKTAILIDSFITSLIAGVLMWLQLVPPWAAALPVALFLISLFIKQWSD